MRAPWVAVLCAMPGMVFAQPAVRPTPLLQSDLQSGKRTKIDAPKDDLDSALDAALGGPQGFSTRELEAIDTKLKNELKRDRPRATPRIVLFLYPGKISVEKLKSMTEIFVDIELVMDPCERSVCREAVGKHIELVGRVVGQPHHSGPGYKLVFQNLTLKTQTQMHDAEVMVYKVPMSDCLSASKRAGGGAAWVANLEKADQDYEPIVTRAIARRAAEKRVSLKSIPHVSRSPSEVEVVLHVKGDRVRVQQQVTDALAAAAMGLRDNPKTPSQSRFEVELDTGMRGEGPRKFRSPGNPVALYLDRKLDGGALWSSYVEEVKKQPGAARMTFDDAEVKGGGGSGDPEPDDNEVIALMAQNFPALGACAKAEAARSSGFRGVTISFKWLPSGQAQDIAPKEAALKNAPIAGCIRQAMSLIRFPRFSGGPRQIDYPIRVK
jgi:hypothetical protein